MPNICGFNVTIGCDPELFIRNEDKQLISAYGLIKGTKEDPFSVDKGAVEVDGMAAEFLIDPANDEDEFNNNIDTVLSSLKGMLPHGYEFDFSPVAEFGEEYIKSQPYEARVLGCSPDFNAYTGLPNPVPNGNADFRTASGHIHIGWTSNVDPYHPNHFEACCDLTKALDYHLGAVSSLIDPDQKRRELYGKLGAFRPKPYGMEYRVLSNFWVDKPYLRYWVFNVVSGTFEWLLENYNSQLDNRTYSFFDPEFNTNFILTPEELMLDPTNPKNRKAALKFMNTQSYNTPKFYRDKLKAA